MAVSTELDLGALARIGMALADATRRVLVRLTSIFHAAEASA
jgi:hypothetical protein